MVKLLKDKTVTTRKVHVCSACLLMFPKGTQMRMVTCVDNNEIYTWKECPICKELLSKYYHKFDDGYGGYIEGCIDEYLERNQTPEMLLNELNNQNKLINNYGKKH